MRLNFRHLLNVFAALAFPAALNAQQPKAAAEFWTWFASQNKEFLELFSYETQSASEDDPALWEKTQSAVKETAKRLKRINPAFSPLFGGTPEGGELIVTVFGESKHFKAVDDFIASAPKVDGWRFIALKQPAKLASSVEIRSGDVSFTIGDIKYIKTKRSLEGFDFKVYAPPAVTKDPAGSRELFTTLMNDFLGERLATTSVGSVAVLPLPKNPPSGLLPLAGIYSDVKNSTK